MKRKPEEYLDSDEYALCSGDAEKIKPPADLTPAVGFIFIAIAVVMMPFALIYLLEDVEIFTIWLAIATGAMFVLGVIFLKVNGILVSEGGERIGYGYIVTNKRLILINEGFDIPMPYTYVKLLSAEIVKSGEEECLKLVFSNLDMIVEKTAENPERRHESSIFELLLGGIDDPHGIRDCIIRAADEAKHSKK